MNWSPEEGDLHTIALGHKDIDPDEMYDLETQREEWLESVKII